MREGLVGVNRYQRSRCAVDGPQVRTHEPTASGIASSDGAEGAERELQTALERSGFESMRMCSGGDITPAALRAIAVSIRSLESSE